MKSENFQRLLPIAQEDPVVHAILSQVDGWHRVGAFSARAEEDLLVEAIIYLASSKLALTKALAEGMARAPIVVSCAPSSTP